MKIVLQRVLNSELRIDGEIYSKIDKGYLLLVSFTDGDNDEITRKMAEKVKKIRLFEDENGKTNLSIDDVKGEIMSVSQFTLYGDLKNGNRPSFTSCLEKTEAKRLYLLFNKYLKELNLDVKEGIFQEDMKITLTNDGPFTIILDSKEILK